MLAGELCAWAATAFAAKTARYVRVSATARQNTSKGYSINEFEVYQK